MLLVNGSHFEYQGRGPIDTSTIHLRPCREDKNQWIEKCEVNIKFSSACLKFRIAACAGLHPFSTGGDPLNSLPYPTPPPSQAPASSPQMKRRLLAPIDQLPCRDVNHEFPIF